eukprot:24021-Eustigmatos_ZCMA.PRE.1
MDGYRPQKIVKLSSTCAPDEPQDALRLTLRIGCNPALVGELYIQPAKAAGYVVELRFMSRETVDAVL